MRPIHPSLIREDGNLVLLTSRDLSEDSLLLVADFRDIQALIYVPTGSWLGVGRNGIGLGKNPIEMTDGIWYMEEDLILREKHQNVRLSPELLSFEVIR